MVTSTKRIPSFRKGELTLEEILQDVADTFKINTEYIKVKCRKADHVALRKIYCYVCYSLVNRYTLYEIGSLVGYKEHSAVLHQIETATEFINNGDSKFNDYWWHFIEHSELWKLHKTLKSL
jgi:chromosomal replication initiation ATPase DnaA